MRYCTHCGAQIVDEAVICIHCGCSVKPIQQAPVRQARDDTMATVIKVFLILGCIGTGWLLIPLAWTIPITVSIFKKIDAGIPVSSGLKVAALLLVNLVSGIILLCADDI